VHVREAMIAAETAVYRGSITLCEELVRMAQAGKIQSRCVCTATNRTPHARRVGAVCRGSFPFITPAGCGLAARREDIIQCDVDCCAPDRALGFQQRRRHALNRGEASTHVGLVDRPDRPGRCNQMIEADDLCARIANSGRHGRSF